MKITRKEIGNFFTKFFSTDKSVCWIWLGYTDKDGYGTFSLNRRPYRAHRVAYLIEFGDFDFGQLVLHTCDNPSCVNPNHLFLGTNKDNTTDMLTKDRNPSMYLKGEMHRGSKFSNETVDKIKELYNTGEYSQRKLESIFSMSQSNISLIVNGRTRT